MDSGGDVIVTQTLSVRTLAAVYVRGSAEYGGAATLLMLVGALDPPDLAAAFDDSRPIVLTGYSGLVATVNSGGGLGNYGYGLIDGAGDNASFAIGATDGRLSLTDARDTPTILTAAAAVNDEHPNTPALTLSLTLRGASGIGGVIHTGFGDGINPLYGRCRFGIGARRRRRLSLYADKGRGGLCRRS